MRTRLAVIAALAIATPLLAACGTPVAITVPTTHPVADISGDWVSTRTLTSTTVSNDALAVGDVVVRDVTISQVDCDADGACTGTVTSTSQDGSTDPTTSTLTFDGDTLAYGFPAATSDCTYTDGTVVSPDAFSLVIDYTFTVSKGDDQGVSEFTGTSTNTVTTSDAALALGCPTGGERRFDVVLARAS